MSSVDRVWRPRCFTKSLIWTILFGWSASMRMCECVCESSSWLSCGERNEKESSDITATNHSIVTQWYRLRPTRILTTLILLSSFFTSIIPKESISYMINSSSNHSTQYTELSMLIEKFKICMKKKKKNHAKLLFMIVNIKM